MPQITNPEEKMIAALWAFAFFIPLIMGKKTEFVTFYMRQNFGLSIGFFVVSFFHFFLGFIGLFNMIFIIIKLIIFCIILFITYMAYNWEKTEIKFALKISDLIISKVWFLKNFFSLNK